MRVATLLSLALCPFLSVWLLNAEEPKAAPAVSRAIHLENVAELKIKPDDVWFFVILGNGEIKRFHGTLVPPIRAEQKASPTETASTEKWRAGMKLQIPSDLSRLRFSVVFTSKGGGYFYAGPRTLEIAKAEQYTASTDDLRAQVLKQKEVLRSWETQVNAQESSLTRLRADAEVVANLGRIIEVREEVERVQSEIANVEKDIENLHKFIKLARTRPSPRNYVSREAKLSAQLTELAQAAKRVENSETSRNTSIESELQKKLALIESTRMDNFDDLQRQLSQLRKRRIQLEQSGTS